MHRHNHAPIQIARLQRHAMDSFEATGEELSDFRSADRAMWWPARRRSGVAGLAAELAATGRGPPFLSA